MKQNPLMLALDLDDRNKILDLIHETKDYIWTYKVGPRLFLKEGPSFIKKIKKLAPFCKVFLDFKFYDIPSSTLSAVQSAFEIGADFVTVHAKVGPRSLKELYQLEKSLKKIKFFKILCVSVLSSVEMSDKTQKEVLILADQVYQSGLRALVCSPFEVKTLREKYSDLFLVTPGIRLDGDFQFDQKRTMTARDALQAGSSALVLGRSILNKKDPLKVLKSLVMSLGLAYASS
ncbi:MAG: orotidine-5'-phosphate decarboxylase [Bdellovibrionales bacterium]|nr:orotidine-5'-phosphate decarboxylase [Bdellovibrionales bacterium]